MKVTGRGTESRGGEDMQDPRGSSIQHGGGALSFGLQAS